MATTPCCRCLMLDHGTTQGTLNLQAAAIRGLRHWWWFNSARFAIWAQTASFQNLRMFIVMLYRPLSYEQGTAVRYECCGSLAAQVRLRWLGKGSLCSCRIMQPWLQGGIQISTKETSIAFSLQTHFPHSFSLSLCSYWSSA